MARFYVFFLLIQAVLFAAELTPPGQKWVVQPFTAVLAEISGFLIQLLGRDIVTEGIIIYDQQQPFAVSIEAGCNGIEALILLFAAVLAFPAPWKSKLWGLGIGFVAVQGLNLVRIVSLFFLGLWNQTAFEWAHLYVWQALVMLDAIVVFLIWIRTLPANGSNDAVPVQ